MPRPLRSAMAVIVLVMSAVVAVPFVRLHTASPLDRTDAQIADGALPRLKFLRQQLEAGAAQQMQGLFPEGYFFMYVLYGLSWVDLAARDGELYGKAVEQARWAMRHLDSEQGRAVFDSELDPEYGVFYAGWTLLLRSGIARLAGPDAPERDIVRVDTSALASAFSRQLNETGSPFLTAYPGQAWPCDSAVGIAAIKVASQVTGEDYSPLITRWLAAADSRRDPATGLLPHTVDPRSGQPTSGARHR